MLPDEREAQRRYRISVALWAVFSLVVGWLLFHTLGPKPVPATTPTPTPPPPVSTPTPEPDPLTEPEKVLRRYYEMISQDDFEAAYRLRSRRSIRETSFEYFKKNWSNNIAITMEECLILKDNGQKANAKVTLMSNDRDSGGQATTLIYKGTVDLVYEEGYWRYDGGDFEAKRD